MTKVSPQRVHSYYFRFTALRYTRLEKKNILFARPTARRLQPACAHVRVPARSRAHVCPIIQAHERAFACSGTLSGAQVRILARSRARFCAFMHAYLP